MNVITNIQKLSKYSIIYGLKILPLKNSHYIKLASLQRRILTMILQSRFNSNYVSLRILIGIPKISIFIQVIITIVALIRVYAIRMRFQRGKF